VIRKGAPIILLLLLASQVLESQELLKPVLKFTNACASNSFNMYDVEVTYIAATFNSDNTFTLELSDASGDFSSPTAIKTISNQNNTFRFTTTFSIPQNTAGSDYKIRVKSSSPEKISPASDAFEAYFMSLENLVLNNFENVTLCEGDSKEISVATSTTNNLQWYKNGQKFTLGGTSITVDKPGLYYCEIYYGACNSPATSNIVEVNIGDAVEAKIIGDSNVYLCENESYTLEASVSNNLYTYSWFKDGVKINNVPAFAAKIGVISGSVLYIISQFIIKPMVGEENYPHFLHVMAILFALNIIIMLIIGKLKAREVAFELAYTKQVDITPWKYLKITGIAICVIVIGIYIYFS